jgi:toxin ParE1/3/4
MKFAFHPDARLEYRDAAAFYENARAGLGAAFTRQIEAALEAICVAPERWPIFEGETRRCVTRRFPYAVLYSIEPDRILILAVMHCSRRPGYWRQRTD